MNHLIRGGVYDWSTGLIYKGGRYFDPMLGIWLALMPLVVIEWWCRRKRKRRGFPWYVGVLVLSGVCVSGTPPTPTPTLCVEATPLGPPLGKNVTFINPTGCWPGAVEDAIVNKFGGAGQGGDHPAAGFGDMDSALSELRISEANPLELVRSPTHGAPTAALKNPTQTSITFFGHFFDQDEITQKAIVVHEMAHQWDYVHNWELHRQMHDWINWGEPVSWKDGSEIESFAYAVEYYFWMERDESRFWTGDLGSGLRGLANGPYYGGRGRDGLGLDPGYESIPLKDRWPSATGTEQVYDRYDWLECEFTAKNCKP